MFLGSKTAGDSKRNVYYILLYLRQRAGRRLSTRAAVHALRVMYITRKHII